MAVGSGALGQAGTNNRNTAIGALALIGLNSAYGAGDNNVAIGRQTMNQMQTGSNCVALGFGAGGGITTGAADCMMIGRSTGMGSSGSWNVMLGSLCGSGLTGNCNFNTWIGPGQSGFNNLNDTFAIWDARGQTNPILDCGITTSTGYTGWIWTFATHFDNLPVGLYIYKTMDVATFPPTNYERGILDWYTTANVFRLGSQAGGTGTVRLIAIDGFQKAGAPAAGDLPSGSFALINDTSGGQTWLAYNAAGTIRKVQLT
jgi:hypothetical protein